MSMLEKVVEGCVLAEAPHWDAPSQSLFFVDIYGKKILKHTPATKKIAKASVAPRMPTFIIPAEGKANQFVISLENELVVIFWDGESDKVDILETLATTENSFNDAKCDPSGRLWAGNHKLDDLDFSKVKPLGILYTIDASKQLKKQIDGIKIANGLAFNEKAKKMYYIDSLTFTIDQFDFDCNSGSISNRQVLFTLEKFSISGLPDGMCIDSDGNLWVALFQGSRVLEIDGAEKDTLLDTIDIPTEQVTSVAFGGPNLDELYVTTGALEIDGKKLKGPEHGAVYRVTKTGAKGHPGVSVKLN